VEHHSDLAQRDRERALEPLTRVLELRQHALRVGRIAVGVPSGEGG
jgi:hypothetical protein